MKSRSIKRLKSHGELAPVSSFKASFAVESSLDQGKILAAYSLAVDLGIVVELKKATGVRVMAAATTSASQAAAEGIRDCTTCTLMAKIKLRTRWIL